jgi:hypothetical protein
MTSKANSQPFVNAMFAEERAGTFKEGYIFRMEPDLTSLQQDPDNGYWRCDIADHERLTWTEKVYEFFGLPAGTAIERDWAVARYSEASKRALESVRTYGIRRNLGFMLDAEITPEGTASRWIRVLAYPILEDGRIVGLHGGKRAL